MLKNTLCYRGAGFQPAFADSDPCSISTPKPPAVDFFNILLEHEEEYIAGRGRFTRYVGDNWVADGSFESNLFIWDSEGIDAVGFMGRDYDVRPAIVTALDLEAPLFALWSPPSGREVCG